MHSKEHIEDLLTDLVLREKEGLDISSFDHEFINKANEYSCDSSRSVRSIIEDLARYCYDEGKMLGSEFMDKFLEYDIAGMLVRNFIDMLPDKNEDLNSDSDPGLIEVRKKLLRFLNGYAKDRTETAHSFIKKKKRIFPEVNFYQLFLDEEIIRIFSEQINQATRADVVQKYKYLFDGEPQAKNKKEETEAENNGDKAEKENENEEVEEKVDAKTLHRENFIVDFFFSRVFKPNRKGDVDGGALKSLLYFIDQPEPGQPGYELENLYMLFYGMFKAMSERREQTRTSLRTCLTDIINSAEYPFLNENFDFDLFFHTHFTPIINEIRAKKLPGKDIELVDVSRTDPNGMGQMIMPKISRKPLSDFEREMSGSKECYISQLRRYFNYIDTDKTKISDDEVLKLVADHLKKAKRQIEYTIKEALTRRERRDPIRQDCRFMPEILNCTEPNKLLAWLADPRTFGRDFPDCADIPYKIVAHQAKTMLEMMLFYRKHIFDNRYKVAAANRKNLESHFCAKDTLDIKGKEEKTVRFRIKMLVNNDQKPILRIGKDGVKGPVYQVIYLEDETPEDATAINYMHPARSIIVKEEDGTYKLFPVEEKKFQRITANIPNCEGKRHECELLVYSGDGNLIHVKSEESYLSSILRGNEPSDICRWLVVTGKKEDGIALSTWLNKNYSDYVKIKDNRNNRSLDHKKAKKRTGVEGSKSFQKNRGYTSSMYAMLPKRVGKKIEHSRINFETQIFDDLDMMITQNVSDYTEASHSRSYVPRREYDNMFRYLFPPVIYGRRFADHILEGYKGNNGLTAGGK